MKNFSIILTFIATLSLTSCAEKTTSISQESKNPLSASRYEQELADTLANFVIQKENFTENSKTLSTIQKNISNAKDRLTEADQIIANGMKGALIPMKASVAGYGLIVGNTLYLSSDFETKPGINLHVYLSEVVDPRDTSFPDPTSVDLGEIQSAYGAQTYRIPGKHKEGMLRTIVLWDKELQIIYSFGQLSK